MAYNPYLNQFNFQNPYLGYQQPQQMQMPQQVPQQMNNGGVISIPSEQDARNYPVAPGNSVIFKDETQPYLYVKSMSFNQMEQPTFEKYRLEKESVEVVPQSSYATQNEIEELRKAYAVLSDRVENIRKSVNLFTEKEVTNAE